MRDIGVKIKKSVRAKSTIPRLKYVFSYIKKIFIKKKYENDEDIFIAFEEMGSRAEILVEKKNFSEKTIQSNITKSTHIFNENLSDEPSLYFYRGENGSGADFENPSVAFGRSVGENFERTLWFNSNRFYKNNTLVASYKNIKERAVNIFSLAGFTKEQQNSHQELQFNENTLFSWTLGKSLTKEKKVFCPLQLISARHISDDSSEPKLRWGVSTGLATSTILDEAVAKGALEIIERDAFMISYLNKLAVPHIDLTHWASFDTDFERIYDRITRYNLEIYLLQLPTDFPTHATLALVIDPTNKGPKITVGASAHPNFKKTALKALEEAVSSRYRLRKIISYETSNDPTPPTLNREGRMVYWAKKNDTKDIDFFLKGKKIRLNEKLLLEENGQKDNILTEDTLPKILSHCKKQNYDLSYVELTTKQDVKKTSLHVANVIMPELQPMHLMESIPYLGGDRLHKIPKEFGYTASRNLNSEPHPFP